MKSSSFPFFDIIYTSIALKSRTMNMNAEYAHTQVFITSNLRMLNAKNAENAEYAHIYRCSSQVLKPKNSLWMVAFLSNC